MVKNNVFELTLVSFASLATIAFGIWHFFIPSQWDWYSYVVPNATELIVAIKAMNSLFSLCLILIGIADFLIILYGNDRFSRIIFLSLSSILWTFRVLIQIITPQGSAIPLLQYGMSSGFFLIWFAFTVGLLLEIKRHKGS